MNAIRQNVKPVAILAALIITMLSGPYQVATAAMIGTETVVDKVRAENARAYIDAIMARGDVQKGLVARGVEPLEAKARIGSLTDTEVIAVADQFEKLPAGAGAIETLLVVALIAFLVLLITDLAGYTNIFPFVRKVK